MKGIDNDAAIRKLCSYAKKNTKIRKKYSNNENLIIK